jgi:hypothetical protein
MFIFKGYGTINNGNTVRGFFKNVEKSAEITSINLDLIQWFKFILSVLSIGYEIDINAFEEYSSKTAQRFVQLNPWYYMPPVYAWSYL